MIPFVMLPLEFVKDLNIFCLYPRECKIFERFPISCAFVSIVLIINICISLLICLYFVSDVCLFAIFRCLDYTRVAALQFGPKRLNTGRWEC